MTGMGKSSRRSPGFSVEAEVKSVNNRYLSVKCHIPEALSKHEQKYQNAVRKRVARGTVNLAVKVKRTRAAASGLVDGKTLGAYIEAVKKALKKERLDTKVMPEHLLGLPGVVLSEKEQHFTAKEFSLIEEAVCAAVDSLVKMRITEGRRLALAVSKRIRLIKRWTGHVEKGVAGSAKERMARLKKRIEKLLDGQALSLSDPTLQREIATLADRSDVTEELDRLKIHLARFESILSEEGEVGRRMDFLIQEMGRETNTIGSKACDADVSHNVVGIKAELEKIREQVQNIE